MSEPTGNPRVDFLRDFGGWILCLVIGFLVVCFGALLWSGLTGVGEDDTNMVEIRPQEFSEAVVTCLAGFDYADLQEQNIRFTIELCIQAALP